MQKRVKLKSNYRVAASIGTFSVMTALVVIASQITPENASAVQAGTQIESQVCVGSPKILTSTLTQPSGNVTVNNNSIQIIVKANWLNKIVVGRDGVAVSTTTYPGNEDETATLTLSLNPGVNNFTLTSFGGCPKSTIDHQIAVTYNPVASSFDPLLTNSGSPKLTGKVNDPSLTVKVSVDGNEYTATNNGDGTWTLPAGTISPDLHDGSYDVRVWTLNSDDVKVTDDNFPGSLVIDQTPPSGTVTTTETPDRSPQITGTVNDNTATVHVEVNGQVFQAVNNGNGTWTLPAGTLSQLASGDYKITVTFTDKLGNKSVVTSTLKVKAPNEVAFVLPPNTGYFRIGQVNIATRFIYMLMAILLSAGIFTYARRREKSAVTEKVKAGRIAKNHKRAANYR